MKTFTRSFKFIDLFYSFAGINHFLFAILFIIFVPAGRLTAHLISTCPNYDFSLETLLTEPLYFLDNNSVLILFQYNHDEKSETNTFSFNSNSRNHIIFL